MMSKKIKNLGASVDYYCRARLPLPMTGRGLAAALSLRCGRAARALDLTGQSSFTAAVQLTRVTHQHHGATRVVTSVAQASSSRASTRKHRFAGVSDGPMGGSKMHGRRGYASGDDVDIEAVPLPPASREQAAVVASVLERIHVACEAVAGSGKTTTILHCAQAAPHLTFLVLTYNARLKLQTRKRARELGLSNVEVHSFHAMGARYYDGRCRNDEVLRAIVDDDRAPHSRVAFDCLVIDEAQDLTPLLHSFVLKVLRDSRAEAAWRSRGVEIDAATPRPSMLVLGDSRQSIYQFRDADCRFLTMADRGLYNLPPPRGDEGKGEEIGCASTGVPSWRTHTLRTSFRATPSIASFVNDAMLGFPCIAANSRSDLSNPAGPPVTYLVGNAFNVASQELVDEIEYLLDQGYEPDDIFVLTPSLKGAKLNSKTPLAQLENTLVMRLNVPVYVSLADEEELSDALIRGKVCLTTFHASKGLERRVVIVFGFAANYFTYYAKDLPPGVCPNPLYVAATRASERLYLVAEEEKGGKLPFLRVDPEASAALGLRLPPWLRVRRCGKLRPEPNVIPVKTSRFAVTDLVKFLPEKVLADTVATLRAVSTCLPEHDVAIDATVPSSTGRGHIESVSDITGLAVVAAHEHRHTTNEAGSDGRLAGSESTSLAAKLRRGLYKMEKTLEESAAARAARKGGQVSPSDRDVDDVGAMRCIREVLEKDPTHIKDFLRLAAWYEAMEGGYLFRPFQLSHFDWVSTEAAAKCAEVLERHLPTATAGGGQRAVPVRYERLYDVSFRFGTIVTILGAADAVTAARDNGEIFEVKCVQRLLPEHLLQLACYQWLDAMEKIQRHVDEEKTIAERRTSAATSGRPHRGFKGTGKKRREYTEEEATDATTLIDKFERTGGNAGTVLKRAVLLNSRTGEAMELQADLRELTSAVLAMVDQRMRVDVAASDEAFLDACAAAGASLHAPATVPGKSGEAAPAPTSLPLSSTNQSDNIGVSPGRTRTARGVVKRRQPAPGGAKVSSKGGDDSTARRRAAPVRARAASNAAAGGSIIVSRRGMRTKVEAMDSVFVRGEGKRAADLGRKVLLGGDVPRPRGRAPAEFPWWDTVAGEYVSLD